MSAATGCFMIWKGAAQNRNSYSGKKDFSRRFEFIHQLYGREEEIVQLKTDYREAASGSKILVSISGYSGIGKTSLVNQIQEEALMGNGMFLQGKFDQYHANVPYFAFLKP